MTGAGSRHVVSADIGARHSTCTALLHLNFEAGELWVPSDGREGRAGIGPRDQFPTRSHCPFKHEPGWACEKQRKGLEKETCSASAPPQAEPVAPTVSLRPATAVCGGPGLPDRLILFPFSSSSTLPVDHLGASWVFPMTSWGQTLTDNHGSGLTAATLDCGVSSCFCMSSALGALATGVMPIWASQHLPF